MFFYSKETNMENDLKDQFAYMNFQTYDEISRCFKQKFTRYCQHFVKFSALQSDFLSEVKKQIKNHKN